MKMYFLAIFKVIHFICYVEDSEERIKLAPGHSNTEQIGSEHSKNTSDRKNVSRSQSCRVTSSQKETNKGKKILTF